jgi:hypothetical protein
LGDGFLLGDFAAGVGGIGSAGVDAGTASDFLVLATPTDETDEFAATSASVVAEGSDVAEGEELSSTEALVTFCGVVAQAVKTNDAAINVRIFAFRAICEAWNCFIAMLS